ncbi:uncharacterized protein B0H64DRAFT_415320 [Chaetomium fimeti]|uniref:Uncharacterized protein n=1 Tax=Chaetomium fimeti TaxID=1854472 RepID=A0AAE0HLG6_9PEZI|nr:hypothetical protein B0H64DRAFT_415320 [Chaetomium fimeti]
MGTGRGNGRSVKMDQDVAVSRKHQHHQAAVTPSRSKPLGNSNPDRKKNKLRVRPMMPKAGMIYFLDRYLLMRERRDRALGVAMRKAFHYVSKPLLNERLAGMFEAAIEFLRRHNSVQPWAQHISKSLFTSLFMILRSTRLNWHHAPRKPLDISQHSLLAKAIDGFNAVDTLSWSTDAPFLRWMIRGGPGLHVENTARAADKSMGVESSGGKGTGMDGDISNNKGTSDHGRPAKLTSPLPVGEEMEGIITHADTAFQLTYEQVIESMRVVSIEVDVPSLLEAFARHNLNGDDGDQATGAPNGERHYSFDDLDVDMVL